MMLSVQEWYLTTIKNKFQSKKSKQNNLLDEGNNINIRATLQSPLD